MDQDRPRRRRPPGFVQFRLPCPCCAGGVQHRARAGVRRHRDGSLTTGSYDLPERCPDCDGIGWLVLGTGEWKLRRRA